MTREIRTSGATLSDVFARAAVAILGETVDPGAAMEEHETREVRAHGDTAEALLAHFLNECLYVLDVEGFVWNRVEFAVLDASARAGAEPMRLHAFLHGLALEPGRERDVDPIAPVDAGAVTLRRTDDGYDVVIAS